MIRVLLVGYGPTGLALAKGVLAVPGLAEIVGVVFWTGDGAQGALHLYESEEKGFQWFVRQQGLPVVKVKSVNRYQFTDILSRLQPDVVLVGSWGEIFKSHVLETSDVRFINCHPSLLPMHRGPNPYIAAILAGDTHSGVTFHLMDAGIDTGPILMQEAVALAPTETGESLRRRLSALAQSMVPHLVRGLAHRSLTPVPQPPGGSYDRIDEDIGWLCWHDSPEMLDRKIRALYPWYYKCFSVGGQVVQFDLGTLVDYPASAGNGPVEPGTLLAWRKRGFVVSTVDPAKALYVRDPVIGGLPRVLNPVLRHIWLRPGVRFAGRPHG